MMKKVKFLYTLVLTSLIILVGGKSLSYADSSVEQLIIINSAYNTLNFYEDGFLVRKFSCATGKAYTSTPQGKTTVANKIKNRPYYKYGIPGGSPNNPLGKRWIGLFDGDTYAIHGTNEASSIGTNASHGCIRMHNSEVEWLYDQINIGATVLIKNTVSSDEQIAKDNGILLGYKWTTKGNDKYFSKNNEEYATGWNTINGKTYYKKIKVGDNYYYFGKDGVMAESEKVKVGDDYYYFEKDGIMTTSKKITIGDDDYYFGEDGAMAASKIIKLSNKYYYFKGNGKMLKHTVLKISLTTVVLIALIAFIVSRRKKDSHENKEKLATNI